MKKYVPIQDAFARYDSVEAIGAHYPGIFTPGHFSRHIREENGQWLVEDKSEASEPEHKNARLSREDMLAIAKATGVKQ